MTQTIEPPVPRRDRIQPRAPRSRGALPGRKLGAGLIPGAGLVLSLALAGCGDDSSTTTPAPAPAPPAAPAAPDPVAVPAGLAVTATGPTFLEFGWEAVEGATGYEIQLSLAADDFSSVVTATVTTTMHRFEIAAETAGHARVRALEGDRQSDWSGTVSGTSAAAPVPPVTLAAPMPEVSDSGPDFIEWSWEPVADALGYRVQVAATEEGLAAADAELITGTTHRVMAEPETERFLRVQAAAGTPAAPILSDWSDAVSGMSDAAPMPFVVGLTPPDARSDRDCEGQVLCPDDGTDPEKAMASVNPMLTVSSSHRARITPRFVEGAAGITVEAGDSLTPFAYAEWNILQSAVLADGATFEFRRMAGGAGQEATPTGDARYITCGPFRCSEAAAEPPAAPEITAADAAVCEAFAVDFQLVKGIYDNSHYWIGQGGSTPSRHFSNHTGLDAGWQYTLSHPATLTHEFTTIRANTPTGTMTVRGAPLTVTSKPLPLDMSPGADTPATRGINWFGGPLNRDGASGTQSNPGPIHNGSQDCIPRDGTPNNLWQISYESVLSSRGSQRPRERHTGPPPNCFRLITDGHYERPDHTRPADIVFEDYLSGYRLHVDPQVGVSWAGSRVDWGDDDPFEALKCERVTIEVSDQVDVCGDFRKEAAAYWGNGIGPGGDFRVEFYMTGDDNLTGKLRDVEIRLRHPLPSGVTGLNGPAGTEFRPPGSRHQHLWLVNPFDLLAQELNPSEFMGLDGTQRDWDLYEMSLSYSSAASANGRADTVLGDDWRRLMRFRADDIDGDPIGDFGKIDMQNNADSTPGSDGLPDNYPVAAKPDLACSDDDGPGCDAELDIDMSATLTRIPDTDLCTYEIEVALTCTWDADGDGRRAGDTAFPRAAENLVNGGNDFLECRVR